MDDNCACHGNIRWCHGNRCHASRSPAYICNSTSRAYLYSSMSIYTRANQLHIHLNLSHKKHQCIPCGTYIYRAMCRRHHSCRHLDKLLWAYTVVAWSSKIGINLFLEYLGLIDSNRWDTYAYNRIHRLRSHLCSDSGTIPSCLCNQHFHGTRVDPTHIRLIQHSWIYRRDENPANNRIHTNRLCSHKLYSNDNDCR